jgi:predicted nucleic acid-binding Zn ribbon protein
MQNAARNHSPAIRVKPKRVCLACGGALPPRRRKYCDISCRQQLLTSLNRRAGLLRALNTRYATFYFTEFVIIMDLLPYDSEQIHSYILPRTPGKKPVDDFCDLSNILGTVWWSEKNRTKKRYLASQLVLDRAEKPSASVERVMPAALHVPSVRASNLVCLELKAIDLIPSQLGERIKHAYRRQVKKHHPDIGGDPHTFLKIQEAYEVLNKWAKHPTFNRLRGFPDKWLYEGANDRWSQPIYGQRLTKI